FPASNACLKDAWPPTRVPPCACPRLSSFDLGRFNPLAQPQQGFFPFWCRQPAWRRRRTPSHQQANERHKHQHAQDGPQPNVAPPQRFRFGSSHRRWPVTGDGCAPTGATWAAGLVTTFTASDGARATMSTLSPRDGSSPRLAETTPESLSISCLGSAPGTTMPTEIRSMRPGARSTSSCSLPCANSSSRSLLVAEPDTWVTLPSSAA